MLRFVNANTELCPGCGHAVLSAPGHCELCGRSFITAQVGEVGSDTDTDAWTRHMVKLPLALRSSHAADVEPDVIRELERAVISR
jgi:hypothetical protein